MCAQSNLHLMAMHSTISAKMPADKTFNVTQNSIDSQIITCRLCDAHLYCSFKCISCNKKDHLTQAIECHLRVVAILSHRETRKQLQREERNLGERISTVQYITPILCNPAFDPSGFAISHSSTYNNKLMLLGSEKSMSLQNNPS